jgi:GNAT superfamily N-acetyltransferase
MAAARAPETAVPDIRWYTVERRPDLGEPFAELASAPWPEFLGHDSGVNRYWRHLDSQFSESQIIVCDANDAVVAAGRAIPLVWDGSVGDLPPSIAEILERGVRDGDAGRRPTTLSALAAVVAPEYQGRGLSRAVLRAMRDVAAALGATSLIAPVRPTWKARYPLQPMDRYLAWTTPDGAPFDPWIRTHWRLGAVQLCLMPESLTVKGTVAQWEEWAGMAFPESGAYVVPGALQPVAIDRERDAGRYVDPNVWMRHPV